MKRRPRDHSRPSFKTTAEQQGERKKLALVLSGGGARAAYQAGALRALIPHIEKNNDNFSIILGSSIGAINGLILAACLNRGFEEAVNQLEQLWRIRTFRNTFSGTPTQAFMRAIKISIWQYMSPGPKPTSSAIFDPTPLMKQVDQVLTEHGGLSPEKRHPLLETVGVMTTIEGAERKPLLFLSSTEDRDKQFLDGASFEVCQVPTLTAKHGFASAALPSVLPPVELDTDQGVIRLVDGGISQNVAVDPAVRLGAERVIIVDISGRSWWLDHYGEPHDTRPTWEVPAGLQTFCMRPPDTFKLKNQVPFGPILKSSVAQSTRKFIEAVGPTWPVFKLLKSKMGEALAYEVMSYVALDRDYLIALMELGYSETRRMLTNKAEIDFKKNEDFKELADL